MPTAIQKSKPITAAKKKKKKVSSKKADAPRPKTSMNQEKSRSPDSQKASHILLNQDLGVDKRKSHTMSGNDSNDMIINIPQVQNPSSNLMGTFSN